MCQNRAHNVCEAARYIDSMGEEEGRAGKVDWGVGVEGRRGEVAAATVATMAIGAAI